MAQPSLTAPSNARRPDWLLGVALVALTGVVFWPSLRWLATETFAKEQLKQSFYVVLLAGGWIAWMKRQSLRPRLQLSNVALAWLFAAYALAGAALLFHVPLFVLMGIVAAAGGLVNFVFGDHAFRRTLPLLAVFGLLILCVLVFPILDWPLRQMAGVESARLLQSLGLGSQLIVHPGPPPRLDLVTSTGRVFIVATECNGFGLITSSLLLGLILLLYRRAGWVWFVAMLPLCVLVAFVFNFLRITAIVLLAPSFPQNYFILHEAAGLVALYSGLYVVWLLTGGQPPVRSAELQGKRV